MLCRPRIQRDRLYNSFRRENIQGEFQFPFVKRQTFREAGTLPKAPRCGLALTYDGEMGYIFLQQYILQNELHAVFRGETGRGGIPSVQKRYTVTARTGKQLEGTARRDFRTATRVYDYGIPMMAFKDGRVKHDFSGQYLDDSASWNWYCDMGWRECIAADLDLSPIGNEKPLRLFNTNILMTDNAFYEIVYASQPLDDKDKKGAQLTPDGSVSPYYPAAAHMNCNLTMRKIELLSAYYTDVRNICTSHVITADYALPINEVITQGYNEYVRYSCNTLRSCLQGTVKRLRRKHESKTKPQSGRENYEGD